MIFGTCTGSDVQNMLRSVMAKAWAKALRFPRKVCGYVIGKSQVGKDNYK